MPSTILEPLIRIKGSGLYGTSHVTKPNLRVGIWLILLAEWKVEEESTKFENPNFEIDSKGISCNSNSILCDI